MPPVDPSLLPPMPAPFWFIMLFKVVGFLLHLIPMGLWFAGTLVALVLYLRNKTGPGRRFSVRFFKQLPVIMALGINFGIVPLLFTQVAFYKSFYTATIIMGWFWLSVIGIVIVAYYGLYFCSMNVISEEEQCEIKPDCLRSKCSRRIPWVLGMVFVMLACVGIIFSSAMVRMVTPDAWPEMIASTDISGAVTGLTFMQSEPSWAARVLLFFGLGLMTTATWVMVDARWFFRSQEQSELDEYRTWARDISRKVMTIGVLWTTLAGNLYLWLTWREDVSEVMFSMPFGLLTLVTGVLPIVILVWVFAVRSKPLTGGVAAITVGLQLCVLLSQVVLRQVVQNIEICRWYNVFETPVQTQWSPIVVFLLTFVFGVVVIGWMLVRVNRSLRSAS